MQADAVSWLTALEERLQFALGPEVCVVCSDTDGYPDSLWPLERVAVEHAVGKRQREFAAGRSAARVALRRMGLPACAIPARPDRSPDWPDGVIGSITHAGALCVAVLARGGHGEALGIDVEPSTSVDETLWPSVCTEEEMQLIAGTEAHERPGLATRIFTAKEAFYKWQFPVTRALLDFHDVRVMLQGDDRFRVAPTAGLNVWRAADIPEGRWLIQAGFTVAWMVRGVPVRSPFSPSDAHAHV